MKNIILKIDGMTCSACSNGLEKYLNRQNGIINANVNLVMSNASIDYDDKILNQEKLEKFIKQAGFTSDGIFKEKDIETTNKNEKSKFVLFTCLAIMLMYISMGHMLKLPTLDIINPKINPITYTIILFIFSCLFLIYGYDILKNGYKNLIHLIPNMDTLVSIGVISSFLYSLYNMYNIINGNYSLTSSLYFESTAIVIYFVKLGRYLDGINKNKTKDAIKKLVNITPSNAVIEKEGKEITVTLDEIKKGNILICKPGEKIAVDGEIIEGNTHLDESFITGESKPSKKSIGDMVIAGSLNYDGYIKYKALKIGKESTISEIVRLVIEGSNIKTPIIVDKISSLFVPIVILIALLTFIIYLILGYNFEIAITTFVTILVVACPCSLGLATPLAIVVSMGECINNGILVKKGNVLEIASKINTVVFDKTGTLTYGKLKISKIYNYSNLTDDEIIKLSGSLESKSSHPVSTAFTTYLEEHKIDKLDIDNFKNISGKGIIGEINKQEIILGNNKILSEYKIKNNHLDNEIELSKNGDSIVYIVKNKEIVALVGVKDIVRENVKEIIKELNNKNIETIMLTGDNLETARKIGDEIGINKVIAGVLPNEKNNIIKELKKDKLVMMCGDGINDSPSLANSDIGVSVKSGTDIAIDSADVVLIKNDLNGILKLINISHKTLKNIKQNLFWAFFYNTLMIPIAMGILKPFGISINPMIASLAMVLSSLTVILNTLRLKKSK